jgi:hypothetical protein
LILQCDLGSPKCGQCCRSRLECSGPKVAVSTFVNRDSSSFPTQTQRQALISAYRARGVDPATPKTVGSLNEFYRVTIENVHTIRSWVARHEFRSLLPESSATSIIVTHLAKSTFSALLADFKPGRATGIFGADRVTLPTLVHYSNVAICIRALIPLATISVPLLDYTIFSLLALYYGRLHGNAGLVELARSSYTFALRHYSQQLEHCMGLPRSDRPVKFQILICASIALQVFEHLDNVDVHGVGHLAHVDGALSMLEEFGATSVQTSTGMRRIFSGFRGIVMYAAIERRTTSYLAEHGWLHVPYRGVTKTSRDRLNDLGLQVPVHLQSADEIKTKDRIERTTSGLVVDQSLQRLNEISSLQRELDKWLHNLKIDTNGPLYWPSLDPPAEATIEMDLECQPKYSNNHHGLVFSCGPIAGLLTQFWCLQLELLLTSIELEEIALRYFDEERAESPSARLATQRRLEQDRNDAEQIAKLILQAEPRLSSCFEGLICIQAPLRTLSRYFGKALVSNRETQHGVSENEEGIL